MRSVRAIAAIVLAAAVSAACGGSDTRSATSATSPATSNAVELSGVRGEVVLTRQRNLVDRGLVTVMVTNESGRDLLVDERRLIAPGFDTAVVAGERIISIRDGRMIAVEMPYGTPIDCDDDAPGTPGLRIAVDGGEATIPLGGADVLHAIRDRNCATQTLAAATDVSFGPPTEDGTELTVAVDVTLTDPARSFTIASASGTILVGARLDDEQRAPIILDAQRPTATIPVRFVVNRCDPHALAEVTKRYGLDIVVSIDGRPAVTGAIDVTPIFSALDGIVDACIAAS